MKKDATEEARDYLKNNLRREFHNYIDNTLAGDFAVELADSFKILYKQRSQARNALTGNGEDTRKIAKILKIIED